MPRRTPRLIVSAMTTAALAAAGLAAVTTAPADAMPTQATYVCEFPLLEDLELPLTLDVPELPAELPVGVPVRDGEWAVEGTLVLPDLVLTLLTEVTGIGASVTNLDLWLDDARVSVDLSSPTDALPLGDIDLPLSGSTREFTPRGLGEQTLIMPDTFDLALVDDLGDGVLEVTCELDVEDGDLGTVDVVKQQPKVNAQVLKKQVKANRRARVLVSVMNELDKGANGQVVAKLGDQSIGTGTLSGGTTRLKLAKLPVGRHRVTLSYLGSNTVEKGTRTVTVRVVKATH